MTQMTTAPAKALTAGEQKNLKALIENDYRRVRHALTESFAAKMTEIENEAEILFPPETVVEARAKMLEALEETRNRWNGIVAAIQSMYPDVTIDSGYSREDEAPVPLPAPSINVYYPQKDEWVAEQQRLAAKARQEAEAQLTAAELEAHRTVLVRGVGSQEALDVLNSIPEASELFRTRNAELEAAPEGES